MDLDTNANDDLTAFFTKRFPHAEDRAHLASAAHIRFREPASDNAEAAWGGLITRAREQSALPRLASCAARKRPADENLQGVAAILSGKQWPPPPRQGLPTAWKQLGALSALFAVAGVAWAARGPGADAASAEPAVVEAVGTAAEPMAQSSAADDGSSAPIEAAHRASGSADHDPTTTSPDGGSAGTDPGPKGSVPARKQASNMLPPEQTKPPHTGSSQPAASKAAATATDADWVGNCRGQEGELVGYWYAGSASPGKKGDIITIPRDLNVRADYPDSHNNYDRRTPIRCTLGVGKKLELTADPIAVPGDAYWVPLHATGRH